jgi:hypothetical protein
MIQVVLSPWVCLPEVLIIPSDIWHGIFSSYRERMINLTKSMGKMNG